VAGAGAALLLAVLGLVGFGAASAYKERRRVEGRRAEVRDVLVRAQAAFDHGAWEEADSLLTAADATTGGEPALKDLRAEAGRLHGRVRRQLDARAAYRAFAARRDEALFHAILSGETDSAERLDATRAEAGVALELAGKLTAGPLAGCLGAPEREEVRFGSYDLYLMLAEAVAQPLPGQPAAERRRRAGEALALLERAAGLGLQTHAYHARRARYLAQAGAEVEAVAERRLAEDRPAATAFDHYLAGAEHYRRGDTGPAVAEFEKALALREDLFWARYFLALSYLREKKPALALRDLTACLARRRAVWILVARGYVQGQLGQFTAAEADFAAARGLLRDHPDPRAVYALLNNRAVTLLARDDFAGAERDLREAVALQPAQYHAYLSLAEARRRQDDPAGALRHMGEAVSAAEALRARQELDDRTLALLYRQRARLHLKGQDPRAAAADLGRAVLLKGLDDDTLLQAQRERGQVLARAGRLDDALAAYDAALALRPKDAETRRARGELLLKLRRYPEAARSFDAYLEAGGQPSASMYQCRAWARGKAGDHAAAVADLTLALGLRPGEEALRLQRGQEYLACQAYPLALRDFEDVIRRRPDSGAAYLGRGLARLQLASPGEAVADAEEAVRLAPEAQHVVYGAACLLAQASGQAGRGTAPGQAGEARWRYQEQAVQLLRQALLLVPEGERAAFWRETVRTDPSLQTIRRAAAYARLERQFEPARAAAP
jgi:tetratricopeptide (TPR) repeat protein